MAVTPPKASLICSPSSKSVGIISTSLPLFSAFSDKSFIKSSTSILTSPSHFGHSSYFSSNFSNSFSSIVS